jgi:hypothetical protein
MTWRRVALAACWIAVAGFGIFYLVTGFMSSMSYAAAALVHFVIGYAIAGALMAKPLTQLSAILAILAAGAFTRIAMAFGVPELLFAPLGPVAAFAAGDWSSLRTGSYSVLAFVIGFAAVIWLTP